MSVKRGTFMNDAAEKTGGGMAAVLKLSNEKVEELCSHYQPRLSGQLQLPGAGKRGG